MAKILLVSVVIFAWMAIAAGQRASFEEKCETAKHDGRDIDTCDPTKFLSCKESRCACKDSANQIWTYKNVKVNSRNKRSPKKGGSKGKSGGGIGRPLLAGAAGGLAGGYIGSKLAQGSSSGSNNNGGSSSSGNQNGDSGTNSRFSNSNSGNYQRSYQCYSRVGGTCLLDRYRTAGADYIVALNQPGAPAIPTTTTTTTTTTAAPGTVVDSNATTTTTTTVAPLPVAAAQVSYDVVTIPECVQYASCLTPEVKIVNGSVVGNLPTDPRLGVCVCQSGYISDNRGLCTRVSRSSSGAASSIPALSTVLMSIFVIRTVIM